MLIEYAIQRVYDEISRDSVILPPFPVYDMLGVDVTVEL